MKDLHGHKSLSKGKDQMSFYDKHLSSLHVLLQISCCKRPAQEGTAHAHKLEVQMTNVDCAALPLL